MIFLKGENGKLKISILIPVFNEEKTVSLLLDRVLSVHLPEVDFEVIVVDDGSTDQTLAVIEKYLSKIILLKHPQNIGKGAALKTAASKATGDYFLVQDADLEYTPNDYLKLYLKIKEQSPDVIFGIRKRNCLTTFQKFSHYSLGARLINFIFNCSSPQKIIDIHAGYKIASRQKWFELELEETGFSFCHEFACKSILKKFKIAQVEISYFPRSLGDGKKIRPIDGVHALITIAKIMLPYRLKMFSKNF